MKDKFWGLKKDEVDRFMKKMEREIQFDLQKHEFELVSIKKENERLIDLIQEKEEKQTPFNMNESLIQLADTRLNTVINIIKSNNELEIASLREVSMKKISNYKVEIQKLEEEIKTINQIIGRFINQLDIGPINKDEVSIKDFEVKKDSKKPKQVFFSLDSEFEKQEQSVKTLQEKILSFQQETEVEELDLKEIKAEAVKGLPQTLTEEEHILEQILSFKEHYLNGKVAGTDLFDKSGNLIIPMNTNITKEIVDRANYEGKLAELIVNMKVSGEE